MGEGEPPNPRGLLNKPAVGELITLRQENTQKGNIFQAKRKRARLENQKDGRNAKEGCGLIARCEYKKRQDTAGPWRRSAGAEGGMCSGCTPRGQEGPTKVPGPGGTDGAARRLSPRLPPAAVGPTGRGGDSERPLHAELRTPAATAATVCREP